MDERTALQLALGRGDRAWSVTIQWAATVQLQASSACILQLGEKRTLCFVLQPAFGRVMVHTCCSLIMRLLSVRAANDVRPFVDCSPEPASCALLPLVHMQVVQGHAVAVPRDAMQASDVGNVPCVQRAALQGPPWVLHHFVAGPRSMPPAGRRLQLRLRLPLPGALGARRAAAPYNAGCLPASCAWQVLDVVMRHALLSRPSWVAAGRGFYYRPDQPKDIGGNVELWSGFVSVSPSCSPPLPLRRPCGTIGILPLMHGPCTLQPRPQDDTAT